jgi:glyceraldehyde 3-phosphate dehydrogenase
MTARVAINASGRIGRPRSRLSWTSPRSNWSPSTTSLRPEEAASNRYGGILGVAEDPIVSADIIKDPRASFVDLESTQVVDGDLVKVLASYDNEWGYSTQMVREAKRLGAG